MRAKIKFNKRTENQAVKVKNLLERVSATANVSVLMELMDYEPAPFKSFNAVYKDLNKGNSIEELTINLLNWKSNKEEQTVIQRIENTIICNLRGDDTNSQSSLVEQIAVMVINEFVGHQAKAFAGSKVYTPELMDRYIQFYLSAKETLSNLGPNSNQPVFHSRYSRKIIVDQAKDIWLQVDQTTKIKLPLLNGWQKALFFFILKNREGFSFEDFRINYHSSQLAEFFVSTVFDADKSQIERFIKKTAMDGRLSKYFSPHFSRLRKKISCALEAYPELVPHLNIDKAGAKKNIHWDRNAIIWQ